MLSLRKFLIAALCVGMVAAQCDDDVEIQSNDDVSQLGSCTRLQGKLTIGSDVTSVNLPETLTRIDGDLVADGAAGLTSLQADGLRSIGGSFTLKGLTVLATLQCAALETVGAIEFATLPALKSLSFTREISEANTVLVTDTVLTSLKGINLVSVERFNINNNRYLESVDVALGNVSDLLVIDANGKGVNASFPELKWANNITLRDCGDMYFPVLEKVNNSAAFVNNTFQSASFPELTEVGQSFAFVSCSNLTNVTANSLEKVGGTFQLANNTKLAKVDGFAKLESVEGAVDMSGVFTDVSLPTLKDVRGGFNLQSTEDLNCDAFNKLKDDGDIQGDGFTCAGKKDTAESKTSGLDTAGSGGGSNSTDSEDAASTLGMSMSAAVFAGVAALMAL